jgi:SAM-dependent methyltransferase
MLERTTQLIQQLDDFRNRTCDDNEDLYWDLFEEMEESMLPFIAQSPTCQLFNGLRLPNFARDMPKLEEDKSVYENCSRWFMQSTPKQALQAILRLIIKFPNGKTFLDVGSGTGFVVALAKELGLEAKGIEGSKVLIDFVPELADLEIYNQDFFQFDKYNEFDLIHLWNPSPNRMGELGRVITSQAAENVAILGLYNRDLSEEWQGNGVIFRGTVSP